MDYSSWVHSLEALYITLYSIILFFLLTPNILLNVTILGNSKYAVALTHAIVFGIVFHLTAHFAYSLARKSY
uniref:Uncharacterized protein n=1 Tax=viral metagenome TaxID=1070528 RepID=A0A6C0B0C2_9ZZZZ